MKLKDLVFGKPPKTEMKRQDMPTEFLPFWNQFVNQFFGTGSENATSAMMSAPGGAGGFGGSPTPGSGASYYDLLQNELNYGRGTERFYDKGLDRAGESRRGAYADILGAGKSEIDNLMSQVKGGTGLGRKTSMGMEGQPGKISFIPRGQREQINTMLSLLDKSTGYGTGIADMNYGTAADKYGRGRETALKYSPNKADMTYLDALQNIAMQGQNMRGSHTASDGGSPGALDVAQAVADIYSTFKRV